MIARLLFTFVLSVVTVLFFGRPDLASARTPEVTIYSVYEADRLNPIFKPFTDRTGIKVNIISDTSDNLIARLQAEGAATTADLHLDKDLVYHGEAQSRGLYQPFRSAIVESNVPASFIESGRHWFTMFYRSRIIMYNKHKVSPQELSTYEDLGSAKWKGRLCVRSSKNSYNEALAAFFVHHFGASRTTQILTSWVNNFSVAPMKSDREVIGAIAQGRCDVGIANSYYLAPFVKADPNFAVRPFFPNQATIGAHVNGVGIGLTKHAKNVAAATLVLEYLSSKEVQAPVAAAFSQYPANPSAPLSDILTQFGPFRADPTNIGNFSAHTQTAKSLMNQAGYR